MPMNVRKSKMTKCNYRVKKPARPPQLRLKTEHYYDVKLPTYEESQKKYAKFMKVLFDDSKESSNNDSI